MKHAAYKDECIFHKRHQSQRASALRQRSTSFCGTLVRSRHQAQGRVPTSELAPIQENDYSSYDGMDLDDPKARSNSAPPCVLTEFVERHEVIECGSIMNARGRVSPYSRSPVGSPVDSPLMSPRRLAPPHHSAAAAAAWEQHEELPQFNSNTSKPTPMINLKKFRSTPNLFPPNPNH